MTYLDPLTYVVRQSEEGIALKSILRNQLKLSRSLLSKLKQTDCGIMLNGARVYTSVPVRAGDLI